MSSSNTPLRGFVHAVSAHRDDWLNVMGNPRRKLESVLESADNPEVAAVLARQPTHTLADCPEYPSLKPIKEAADAMIDQSDLRPGERDRLRAASDELLEAHRMFAEAARRSYDGGLREADHGIPVLRLPLPEEAICRLAEALLDADWCANMVERERAYHNPPAVLSLTDRAAQIRKRIEQARDHMRGAATAGQRPPKCQEPLDEMLLAWERHLAEWTPPARRVVTTPVEAADALNDLLREMERRQVLPTPGPTIPPTESGGCASPAGTVPNEYLIGWREILNAVGRPSNSQEQVRRLNTKFDGPIILPGQGGQPKVEKTRLIEWWNRLDNLWEEQDNEESAREEGRTAATSDQYTSGTSRHSRTEIPEIKGHAKRSRKPR